MEIAIMTTTQIMGKLIEGDYKGDAPEARGRFIPGVMKALETDPTDSRILRGRASTINLDRDDEIILPSAFASRLGRFTGGHRPMLGNHDWWPRTPRPSQVGWVREIEITGTDIPCAFLFALTDPAEEWLKLGKDPKGFGIAFSIGFTPIRWVFGSVVDLVAQFPEIAEPLRQAELSDDAKIRIYTEIELMEISCVGVPSNRESTQILAAAFGGKGPQEILETLAGLDQRVTDAMKKIDILIDSWASAHGEYTAAKEAITALYDELIDLFPDYVNPRPGGERSAVRDRGPDGGKVPGSTADGQQEGARILRDLVADLRKKQTLKGAEHGSG
jgi:hypothetical protein